MGFLWWGTKESSSAGAAQVEPVRRRASVRTARAKEAAYADTVIDKESGAYLAELDKAIMSSEGAAELETMDRDLEVDIFELQLDLDLKKAAGANDPVLVQKINDLRAQRGRVQAPLKTWEANRDSQARVVRRRKSKLKRELPNQYKN